MPKRWWIPSVVVVVVVATLAAAVRAVEDGGAPASPTAAAATADVRVEGGGASIEESLAVGALATETDVAETQPDGAAGPEAAAPPPEGEPLAWGERVAGRVGGDETVSYRLEGRAGSLVRIRVDGLEAMDPVTSLFGPSGELVLENDDESSVNRDSLLVLRLPEAGWYVLRVRPFDGASGGAYEVEAAILPERTDEPPLTLASDARMDGYLADPLDRDEYFVDLHDGESVTITADGGLGVDTYVEVFGPHGDFIAADDDSGHGLDGAVQLESPAGGRYRVEVSSVASKIGAYRLSLEPFQGEAPAAGVGREAETLTDHPAGHAVLNYWNALQREDVGSLLGLAGPEALRLWGWRSADDVRRDLVKLQSVGVSGFPVSVSATAGEDRARVVVSLSRTDGGDDGTLVADATRVAGEWRVELLARFFPLADTGYDGPLPLPSGPPPLRIGRAAAPVLEALAAIVVDAESGAVLLSKDEQRPLAPASLTKIATAILTVEAGGLDTVVRVDVDSGKMRGSSLMGLRPGDTFSVRDLLYGLMLESGNDAALALGRHLAGDDASFVAELNALLARVGLTSSTLTNPHGLDDTRHRMTAYDVAMLSRYALSFPEFQEVVSTVNWTARGSRPIGLENGNAFLGYRGADGVKTGFTTAARETLSASASRNGHRVIVVLLNAPARFAEAAALMDWVFQNYCWPSEGNATQACTPPG